MRKAIGILLVILLVVAGGGLYYVWTHLGGIVKTEIETYGSAATGTKVSLSGVGISIPKGSAALKGLSIANPAGYDQKNAVSVGEIAVALDTSSVMGSGPIVIKSVTIEAPDVDYEAGLRGSNLAEIQKHVTEYANSLGGKQSTATAGANKGKPARKLIIKDLYIRHGKLSISHSALKGKRLSADLPEIHLTNIGQSKGGATYAEVSRQVIGTLMKSASKVATQKLIDKIGPLGGTAGSGATTIIKGVGGLLGR